MRFYLVTLFKLWPHLILSEYLPLTQVWARNLQKRFGGEFHFRRHGPPLSTALLFLMISRIMAKWS